ncbi:MAG: hypothetical protein IPM83_16215 [Ignavibacteria bacterium]|nr:hypothetical protein [Ignavibacteria bacterium]
MISTAVHATVSRPAKQRSTSIEEGTSGHDRNDRLQSRSGALQNRIQAIFSPPNGLDAAAPTWLMDDMPAGGILRCRRKTSGELQHPGDGAARSTWTSKAVPL